MLYHANQLDAVAATRPVAALDRDRSRARARACRGASATSAAGSARVACRSVGARRASQAAGLVFVGTLALAIPPHTTRRPRARVGCARRRHRAVGLAAPSTAALAVGDDGNRRAVSRDRRGRPARVRACPRRASVRRCSRRRRVAVVGVIAASLEPARRDPAAGSQRVSAMRSSPRSASAGDHRPEQGASRAGVVWGTLTMRAHRRPDVLVAALSSARRQHGLRATFWSVVAAGICDTERTCSSARRRARPAQRRLGARVALPRRARRARARPARGADRPASARRRRGRARRCRVDSAG